MLCKYEKCMYYLQKPHPKTGRKCFYEPGCILGTIDEVIKECELLALYKMKRI